MAEHRPAMTASEARTITRLLITQPDLLAALDKLQIIALDAAVNSVPEAHVRLRQELMSACAQARDAIAKARD